MDVYLLTVRDAGSDPFADPPVAVIVHARSLLHPRIPQPDGGRVYRCLTEFPGRAPGCLVPLSTLDYELGNGRLWAGLADRQAVLAALADLADIPGQCESLRVPLVPWDDQLLTLGPYSHILAFENRGEARITTAEGTIERNALLTKIAQSLPEGSGRPPLWPGDGLLPPPPDPAVIPYEPYGT